MISALQLLKLDRYFGIPHKIVEWILLNLLRPKNPTSDHVMVIKLMGMGSIVRFASLCDQHHIDKSRVTLITFSFHREVCALWDFTHVYFIRSTNVFKFLVDILGLFAEVRKHKLSLIVDLERSSHAVGTLRILLALYGHCNSLSFEPGRFIQTKRLTVHPADKISLVQLFMLGLEKLPRSRSANFKTTDVNTNTRKILVNVNASDLLPARRYSIQQYVQLIKCLHQRHSSLEFYLTGSTGESNYVNQLADQLRGLPVHHCAGLWSLSQLIRELSDCALFITGDSGPLHLAIHLGVPTLAIWGPTQPAHFGYKDTKQLTSLTLGLSCSPCFTHPGSRPAAYCKGLIDCLTLLSPDHVAERAEQLLAELPVSRQVNFPRAWKNKQELHHD